MFHTWRVRTRLIVPKEKANQPAVGETLQYVSRVPPQARNYGGIPVAIQMVPGETPTRPMPDGGPSIPDQGLEFVELVADVQVPSADNSNTAAVERYSPLFGTLIDLLSFDMGAVLAIARVSVIDITPPVAVGDERTAVDYSSPPIDRYMRAQELGSVQGRLIGQLPASADVDSKTSAVLRWYVKAASTDVLHDQFIFLWIAVEILGGMTPSVRVDKTYVAQCGHEIPACPQCGRTTAKKVEGSTKKAFLESHGVSPEQATELWRMRQMMHGAIRFDSKEVAGLGGLIAPLRAAVAADLKRHLGTPAHEPPLVTSQAMMIVHPAFGLGGTRAIKTADITPLIT